jgi:hypothetical protein
MIALLILGSLVYFSLGFLVLWVNFLGNNIQQFWSPLQPLAFICFWPIVVIADMINKIRKP